MTRGENNGRSQERGQGERMSPCERCGQESCGAPEYVIASDAMLLRVGFRCAVEAVLTREEFPGATGGIEISVVQ